MSIYIKKNLPSFPRQCELGDYLRRTTFKATKQISPLIVGKSISESDWTKNREQTLKQNHFLQRLGSPLIVHENI